MLTGSMSFADVRTPFWFHLKLEWPNKIKGKKGKDCLSPFYFLLSIQGPQKDCPIREAGSPVRRPTFCSRPPAASPHRWGTEGKKWWWKRWWWSEALVGPGSFWWTLNLRKAGFMGRSWNKEVCFSIHETPDYLLALQELHRFDWPTSSAIQPAPISQMPREKSRTGLGWQSRVAIVCSIWVNRNPYKSKTQSCVFILGCMMVRFDFGHM